MISFKMAQPKNKSQLSAFLTRGREGVYLMAGGTDLLDEVKQDLIRPETVVDLGGVRELFGQRMEPEGLSIGAMTTISELADFPAVGEHYPGLRQAALSLASPQLRNVGTVGGNLCQRPRCWYYRDAEVLCRKKGGSRCYAFNGRSKYHAVLGGSGCFIVHPSDLAPMLIALGASAEIRGPEEEKRVSLEDFFQGPGADVRRENILGKDQIMTGVFLPKASAKTRSSYVKYRERGAWDFAVVSAAAAGQIDGGTYRNLRIVLGGAAPVPWRAKEAERLLEGRPLTDESIERAASEEMKKARALKDNSFKIDLIPEVIKESLLGLGG